MHFLEVSGEPACQVVGTKGMGEPVVRGGGENILAGGQLLNGSKTLKFGSINDGCMRGRDQNIPVNLVANHSVPTVHDTLPASRVFIALLGNQGTAFKDNA